MSKIVGDIAVTIGADITPLQTGLKKGSAEVINFGEKAEAMGRRVKGASADANRLGGAMGRLSNVSRQTRAQIQNASYQFQDMAVQFQMGTKTSTVLSQQLPQLASAFGPVGAAVGVLAGVGIPLLVAAFGDIFEGAESLEDVMKSLRSAMDEYASAADLATMSTDELKEKFGAASAGLQTTLNILEQISRNEAQRAIDGIGESLAEMLGTRGAGDSRTSLADFFDVNIMFAFTDAQRAAREEARELTSEFQASQRALSEAGGDLNKQIPAMQALLRSARSLAEAKDGISAAEEEVIKKIAETLVLMEEQRGKVQEVEESTHNLADAFKAAYDSAAAQGPLIDGLIGKVQTLARAAWDYAGAMGADAPKGGRGGDPRQYDGRKVFRDQLSAQDRWKAPKAIKGSSGGGGGSAGVGLNESELEAIRAQFATEQELLDQKYQTTLEKLQEFREAKMLKEAEYNELEAKAKADHEEKLANLEQKAQAARLQAVSGALGDVASLMQSENSKLFKIGKAAAIAEATVSGYQAAVTAWQKGMSVGGPPVAAAFTAASLAKTGSLIAGIASQSASGGSSAGSAAVAGASIGAEPTQRRFAEFSVSGTNVTGLGELVDQINQAVRDGYEINIVNAA